MSKMESTLSYLEKLFPGHSTPRLRQLANKWIGDRNRLPFERYPIVIGHEGHVVAIAQQFARSGEVIWIPNIVCIEQRQPFSAGSIDPEIPGGGGIPGLASDDPGRNRRLLNPRQRVVAGRVIHDDNFRSRQSLSRHTLEGRSNPPGGIVA